MGKLHKHMGHIRRSKVWHIRSIRSRHRPLARHQRISFRSKLHKHMGKLRRHMGKHHRRIQRMEDQHIHRLRRGERHQPWPLAQHQQISFRSKHMGIRIRSFCIQDRKHKVWHIRSIRSKHQHQPQPLSWQHGQLRQSWRRIFRQRRILRQERGRQLGRLQRFLQSSLRWWYRIRQGWSRHMDIQHSRMCMGQHNQHSRKLHREELDRPRPQP